MHDKLSDTFLTSSRRYQVKAALAEDLGLLPDIPLQWQRDVTACLVPAEQLAQATIITREAMILCGSAWLNEAFAQLDATSSMPTQIDWAVSEGQYCAANTILCRLNGLARTLLSVERTALNFLQALSGTATTVRNIVDKLPGNSQLMLLDTRKTLPGLRTAQKYAVRVGGGHNHRIGLFDAFLIKENHIAACGSIAAAVNAARALAPTLPVEVEVENFDELQQALMAKADIIMLDEFPDHTLPQAVAMTAGRAKLEVSGSVSAERLQAIAQAGIDYVSMGALTKHVRAIDLSMRIGAA